MILLLGISNPKLIKGSMGAVFTIPFIEFENVLACKEWLFSKGFTLYMADTRAEKTFTDFTYNNKSALVIGNERYGIDKEWYTPDSQLLSIPMLGACDSLNAGVAASIILYDISIKSWKTKNTN